MTVKKTVFFAVRNGYTNTVDEEENAYHAEELLELKTASVLSNSEVPRNGLKTEVPCGVSKSVPDKAT